MATADFKLPELGENIETGDVVRVTVSPGETVHEGQTVVELETDKAVVEVPSTVNGVVDQVRVNRSQKVKAGDVLFTYEPSEGGQQEPREAKMPPSAQTKPAAERRPPGAPKQNVVQMKARQESTPQQRSTAEAPPAPAPARAAQPTELKLPELGENIHSGDVVKVSVQPGDQLTEGQTVLELETDKAVVEVPSSMSGKVEEVRVKVGQQLKVGETILTLSAAPQAQSPAAPAREEAAPVAQPSHPSPESGEGMGQPSKAAQPPQAPAQPQADESDEGYMAMARHSYYSARTAEGREEAQAFPPDVLPETEMHAHPPGLERHAGHEHRTVPAAPSVRRLAREIGVDIYQVTGTSPGGRISEDDVKSYAKSIMAQVAAQEATMPGVAHLRELQLPDFSRWGKIERVPMRAVRRKTAEHLSLAWNVVAHVTQFDKADVTELEQLRQRFSPKAEKAGGKMTMTAIALKVVASALKAFPQFNASIDMASEQIIYKRYINLGVAVDTDRGLLVPVIRDADKKNIIDLAVELAAVSKKAHDKKLSPEEMDGGTFTITNLGGVGGTAFTPIVNHPEVAILGISRTQIEPVWVKEAFEPRSMLPLSLSYDHRLIDGADAARFLRWIVDALEQPFLLSVQG